MINDDGFDIEINMQQALEKTKDMQFVLPQDMWWLKSYIKEKHYYYFHSEFIPCSEDGFVLIQRGLYQQQHPSYLPSCTVGCNPIMSEAPYWFAWRSLRGNHGNRCLVAYTRRCGTLELRVPVKGGRAFQWRRGSDDNAASVSCRRTQRQSVSHFSQTTRRLSSL